MTKTGQKRKQIILPCIICILGIALNVGGGLAAKFAELPLYFDTAGTMLAAFFGGYIPGIMAALLTNIINYFYDEISIYYGAINVLIAMATAFAVKSNRTDGIKNRLIYLIVVSVISAGIGGIITWFRTGLQFSETDTVMAFLMQWRGLDTFIEWYGCNFVVNLVDKAISMLVAGLFIYLVPKKYWQKFELTMWMQEPISNEQLALMFEKRKRPNGLNKKIIIILTVFSCLVVAISTMLSLTLFRQYSIGQHTNLAVGVSRMAAAAIDGDSVDRYLNEGVYTSDYIETQRLLKNILDNTPEVEFIYAYKILADGCHVVFDLDTTTVRASNLGDVVPFDNAFMEYMPQLLNGERIDPIISDDAYGWLLTAYEPVYDSDGNCVCYAAVDIEMQALAKYEGEFLAKLIGIFSGFLFLILSVILWISKYQLLMPVCTMTEVANNFKYGDEFERKQNLQNLSALDISTGGEIESLYRVFLRAIEESTRYFEENKRKLDRIETIQKNFVLAVAEMIATRSNLDDTYLRRTYDYMSVTTRSIKALGYYNEQLTDKFVKGTVMGSPLRDVGKLVLPDEVLGNPDDLTEEQITVLRTHTTEGGRLLERMLSEIPEIDYLEEAKNIAVYHHEQWNGGGYPKGLAGEEIPLSARIMAVVDAFDVKTSPRFDKPLSADEAIEKIKEGSGIYYDPLVVEAFIKAESEIKEVLVKNSAEYLEKRN